MGQLTHLFQPPSLGVAVLGATLAGFGIVGVGVGSMAVSDGIFSLGIGAVLIAYGALVLFGAWLGLRRNPWARGMIVAPALLHVATAVSIIQSGGTTQVIGASVALVILVATVVAGVLPATHAALGSQGNED